MAQRSLVAPALEGSYAGGTAATLGLTLRLVAQDSATWAARQARESDGADALLAATEDLARILDFYVEVSAAAAVTPPPMPAS